MLLTHADLFSGIGGFSLAAESCGLETVLHCERDKDRIRDLRHYWPEVPIVEDVNDVEGIERTCTEQPYLLTAGVPCQPASAAGKRLGAEDDRWLWPQTIEVVRRLKPRWCIFENPTGILSLRESAGIAGVEGEADFAGRTLCEIATALVRAGYEFARDSDGNPCFPIIPACAVGAFHRRDRVWIVCRLVGEDAECERRGGRGDGNPGREGRQVQAEGLRGGSRECGDVGDGIEQGLEGQSGNGNGGGESGRQREEKGRSTSETGGTLGDASQQRINNRAGDGGQGRRGEHTNPGGLPDWSAAILSRGADGTTRVVKPGLHLLAHGVPGRVAKLRGLGNAVVPRVVREIIWSILSAEYGNVKRFHEEEKRIK